MTNVVVSRPRQIHISTNATAGIIDSTTPVTLKNNPTVISMGNTQLAVENLTNVEAAAESNGTTLVFNSATGQWVAQYLNFAYVTGALDGGTF